MDKNKILVFGNFNIVHPGHLRLLRFAKSLKGHLIVAVSSDRIAGNEVHVPEDLRLEVLKTNNWVDEAFIYDEPIIDIIKKHKPDYVVKGKEYENQQNEEEEIISSYGGKLVFSSGDVAFSSIDLLRKEMLSSASISILEPTKFMKRHKIINKNIIDLKTGYICDIK